MPADGCWQPAASKLLCQTLSHQLEREFVYSPLLFVMYLQQKPSMTFLPSAAELEPG